MEMKLKRSYLIFNPTAGALRREPSQIDKLTDALRAEGIEVIRRATTSAGDATRISQEAVSEGAEVVVVCGGDGRINEGGQPVVGTDTIVAVGAGGKATG